MLFSVCTFAIQYNNKINLLKDDIYIFVALSSVYLILLTVIPASPACVHFNLRFPSIEEVKKSKYNDNDISDIYSTGVILWKGGYDLASLASNVTGNIQLFISIVFKYTTWERIYLKSSDIYKFSMYNVYEN